MSDRLLTKDEVAKRLRLKRRGVEGLVAQRKIPVIRISHRCVRFDWQKVSAAIARFEVREVGR
jgi:excisionase family DNA binding protein